MGDAGAAVGGIAILGLVLATMAFWIWTLVDAIRVRDESTFRAGSRLAWVVVIAVTGFIGSIVYLAVGRPRPALAGGRS